LIALAACGGTSDGELARTFDPCAPIAITVDGSVEEASGVDGGLALWRTSGVTGFDAATGGDALAIRFQDAAPAFHGFYDDTAGIVYINHDVTDPGELAIVVAHELGHAFGLLHVQDRVSLMNPGNLATPPTDDDRAALVALWGACR
jgi:hypothetical protein